MKKRKPKSAPVPKCEIGTIVCGRIGVRHMTGVKKGDPKFHACMGCVAYLKRRGVRMKEVE